MGLHYLALWVLWGFSAGQRAGSLVQGGAKMADRFPPPEMKISREEMDTADIPYAFRDYCAHMWVDYKECRTNNPVSWRKSCHHEVHGYNKCEYKEFKRRVAIAIEEKKRRGLM